MELSSIITHCYICFLLAMRTFKIHFLSNFKWQHSIINTNYNHHTVHHTPWLVCSIIGRLYLWLPSPILLNSQPLSLVTTHLFSISRQERKKVKLLSCIWLFATSWTVAYQAALSMGFSRQEYWSGVPFPSPGDLPDPGIEPRSPAL